MSLGKFQLRFYPLQSLRTCDTSLCCPQMPPPCVCDSPKMSGTWFCPAPAREGSSGSSGHHPDGSWQEELEQLWAPAHPRRVPERASCSPGVPHGEGHRGEGDTGEALSAPTASGGRWGRRRVAAEQPLPAALPQHRGQGSLRKSHKHQLVVPHEQQLGCQAPTGIPGWICQLAKWGPGTKEREVGKGEMLPGTSWGTRHVMARAVPGSPVQTKPAAPDCGWAPGPGVSWSVSTPWAGEAPALPSASPPEPNPRALGEDALCRVGPSRQDSQSSPALTGGVGGGWRAQAPHWKHSTENFGLDGAKAASLDLQPVSRLSVPAACAALADPLDPPWTSPRAITFEGTPWQNLYLPFEGLSTPDPQTWFLEEETELVPPGTLGRMLR